MPGYLTRREILKKITHYLMAFFLMAFFSIKKAMAGKIDGTTGREHKMNLPRPITKGKISVEQAVKHRRTIRSYLSKPLSLEQLSQIFWAAQGITEDKGYKRSAPSAGALYPMDIYAVVGENGVKGLKAGIYHYDPRKHAALLITEGDFRKDVAKTALSQMWMARAPLNLVITSEYRRITSKYGSRGERYAMIEAGHVGQNIFLQAQALGLRAGIVGAFHDNDVIRVMKIKRSHEPLLILPVGYGA
ncbi:MAG: SagB/ThcOx family dehydrogenase [Deltaproteobacteria bacterium]|nr:SagB/ThcOx family dehydrogenase [Deltaproteobacteria bacterium]